MKKITIIIIAAILALPSLSFALTGEVYPMIQYNGFFIEWRQYEDVAKLYDHDEEVICYVLRGSQAISCVKDN